MGQLEKRVVLLIVNYFHWTVCHLALLHLLYCSFSGLIRLLDLANWSFKVLVVWLYFCLWKPWGRFVELIVHVVFILVSEQLNVGLCEYLHGFKIRDIWEGDFIVCQSQYWDASRKREVWFRDSIVEREDDGGQRSIDLGLSEWSTERKKESINWIVWSTRWCWQIENETKIIKRGQEIPKRRNGRLGDIEISERSIKPPKRRKEGLGNLIVMRGAILPLSFCEGEKGEMVCGVGGSGGRGEREEEVGCRNRDMAGENDATINRRNDGGHDYLVRLLELPILCRENLIG